MMEEFVKSLGVIPLTVRYFRDELATVVASKFTTNDGGGESHRIIPMRFMSKIKLKEAEIPIAFFHPKKKTVAPVATPHKHHKQVGCSLSGRSSRAPEVSTAHGVLVKLKERPGAEKSLWAIEMEFNEAAFEWSFFVLFGRFVLEVQGLLNA